MKKDLNKRLRELREANKPKFITLTVRQKDIDSHEFIEAKVGRKLPYNYPTMIDGKPVKIVVSKD